MGLLTDGIDSKDGEAVLDLGCYGQKTRWKGVGALRPLMEDRRNALARHEYTVSECACMDFLDLSGQIVTRTDHADIPASTPALMAFLDSWWARERKRLVWDPDLRHYRKRKPTR